MLIWRWDLITKTSASQTGASGTYRRCLLREAAFLFWSDFKNSFLPVKEPMKEPNKELRKERKFTWELKIFSHLSFWAVFQILSITCSFLLAARQWKSLRSIVDFKYLWLTAPVSLNYKWLICLEEHPCVLTQNSL